MNNFATATRAPRTLTETEVDRLLKLSGQHSDTFRDHMIFALALGTGLREHEIVALELRQLTDDVERAADKGNGVGIRRRLQLDVFKNRSRGREDVQEVFLPDSLVAKLGRFLKWKRSAGESMAPDAPLFASWLGGALTTRAIRNVAAKWRELGAFDWPWGFHALRHTALTSLYRKTRDLRLVQRAARHASIATTTIYAGPSDDDVLEAVRDLTC